MMKILFMCCGTGEQMKSYVARLKPVKVIMNVRNARNFTLKVTSGYAVQYVINGTIKTVFMSNLSHPVILLDHINRLSYLLITFYMYG